MVQHKHGRVEPIDDMPAAIFLILIVAMVATPLVASLFVAGVDGPAPLPFAQSAVLLVQELVLALLTVGRLRRLGVSLAGLRVWIDDAAVAVRGVVSGCGLVVTNLVSSQLSVLAFTALLGQERLAAWLAREQGAVRRLLDTQNSSLELGLVVFLAVGVAPIVEELFFRGYAYPVFKKHVGRHAVWCSALVFAGVHMYVINFLPVFVIGVILARLYERTGSLATAIVAHATANGAVAILAVWAGRALG